MSYNTGIVKDRRSSAEKAKDWTYGEIASGVEPELKPIESWEAFSVQNQVQSSSCVWQAIAKSHEVIRFRNRGEKINHSAGGYSIRSNKPGLGTFVAEGMDQAVKYGVPFEEDIKSEGLGEAEMNAIPYLERMKQISDGRKTFTNAYIPYMPKDFLTAAKEIAKGHPVPLLVRCNILEWNQGVPQIYGGKKDVSHEITGVQAGYFTGTVRGNKGEKIKLENKLVIRVDDSWGNLGFESKGFRLITQEFFDAYVDQVSMFLGFTYKQGEEKPVVPTVRITYGDVGPNVKKVQEALRYLGYFPLDIDTNIAANNRFGPVTRSHVKKFHMAHIPWFEKLGTTEADLRKIDGKRVWGQTLQLIAELMV